MRNIVARQQSRVRKTQAVSQRPVRKRHGPSRLYDRPQDELQRDGASRSAYHSCSCPVCNLRCQGTVRLRRSPKTTRSGAVSSAATISSGSETNLAAPNAAWSTCRRRFAKKSGSWSTRGVGSFPTSSDPFRSDHPGGGGPWIGRMISHARSSLPEHMLLRPLF